MPIICTEARVAFGNFFIGNETDLELFYWRIISFYLRCEGRKIYGDSKKEDDVKKPHCR